MLSSVTFVTYLLALVIAIVLLAYTAVGQDLLSHEGSLVLGAFLFPLPTPVRINLLVGFLGILLVYVACFVTAIKAKGGFVENLRGLARGTGRRIPNWLVVMPPASSALLIIVITIAAIQNLLGVPSGSLSFPESYTLGQQLYTLAYSPVLEEAAFRITTLGLLVSLRAVLFKLFWFQPATVNPMAPKRAARVALLSFFFPDRAKTEAGLPNIASNGWRGIHPSEWVLLVATSAIFGLAHILTDSGWEPGKVLTAALSGFALGLAYLIYGAYASILLHWFFNFYFEVYSLSSYLLGGIFYIVGGLVVILTFSVGILGIGVGVIFLLRSKPVPSETPHMAPSGRPRTV